MIARVLLLSLLAATAADASERIPLTIRDKTLTLELYRPSGATVPRATVLMGSGDVGWVGLGADLAEFLSTQGYAVIGINVRQYLASFTSGSNHIAPEQVPRDYTAIVQFLRDRRLLWNPVYVAGVSEGAALAVLAASDHANHAWIKGVLTMGLPPTAELAWRWTDVTAWITKKDPNEPSFEPRQYLGAISPLPLWMIQSTKDEYVKEADYRTFEREAKPPRRLVLIDASNHRFTDRLPQLRQQVLAGLAWMQDPG